METTNKSNKLCGILFIILGVISVLVSEDNGCYDLTAALLLNQERICKNYGKRCLKLYRLGNIQK